MVAESVDVVVPCHNGWELTRACLESLRRQTLAHTAFVADDGSDDDTPARVREEFPEVRLVELGTNRGYTTACNAGIAAGGAEFVVLINNDTELEPDFLAEIVRPLADEAVGAVVPVMVRPDGRIDNVGLAIDATLAGYARLQGRPLEEAAGADPPLGGPSGGAGAYRRRAWEQAGGLDERIFIYSDDVDLAVRLRGAGWAIAPAPSARCLHHGSQTMRRRSASQRGHHGFSRGYLLRRYGVLRTAAGPRALLTEAVVCAGDVVISRDLVALRSRLRGWRAARGLPRHELAADAVSKRIGLLQSLRLRGADYRLARP